MAETITLIIDDATAADLRQLAARGSGTVEELAAYLLSDTVDERLRGRAELSEEDLADLEERIRDPGPYASPERVEEVLGRFRKARD